MGLIYHIRQLVCFKWKEWKNFSMVIFTHLWQFCYWVNFKKKAFATLLFKHSWKWQSAVRNSFRVISIIWRNNAELWIFYVFIICKIFIKIYDQNFQYLYDLYLYIFEDNLESCLFLMCFFSSNSVPWLFFYTMMVQFVSKV